MAAKKILGLGVVVVFLGGCQSWQYRDIEKLPPTAAIPEVSEPGKVDVWYFDGISGNNVQSLIDAEKFPDSPDEITELNQLRRAANRANNYGTLIRGYLEPPATGEYTFYIAGDDETQLWLSPSQSPEDIVRIASTMATPLDNFTRYSSQTSGIHYLEAGQKYYFYSKITSGMNFEQAVEKVTFELQKEGFGILSNINIKDTFKKKLNVDFKKYTILGACNPHYAHKILQKEDKIGVFLPCNIVIEENENKEIEIAAVNPIASLLSVNNDNIGCFLIDIQQKLKRAIDKT